MDTDNSVIKAWDGAGARWRGTKWGWKWGTSVLLSTIKNIFKMVKNDKKESRHAN